MTDTLEQHSASSSPGHRERVVTEVDRRHAIACEAEVDANLKRAQALQQAVLTEAFGAEP